MQRMRKWVQSVHAWWAGLTPRQLAVLFAVAAIVVVGAVLRAWVLFDRPLWEDEAYTWQDCQVPLWRLLWWKHDPAHGPASHILVRLSIELFGTDDVWAMRLPSLACGILCIPVAFWLGRTIHGDALGLGVAALVAVDPNMVDQSQQARMYAMLALASMLVLGQAIRLLRDPPALRRGWVVLAVLLSVQFWINFGAVAMWLGLAAATGAIVLTDYRAGGERAVRAHTTLHGMATAYGLAVLLSARGIWRMYIFVSSDRGIPSTTANDALYAMWQGFAQLTSVGGFAAVVLLAALFGLCLLWRHSPAAAYVLAATALATVMMIYAGRSVHHMIAARYFTVLQPTMWIALAALPVLATKAYRRAILTAGLLALLASETWLSLHIDRWGDINTWRYACSASRFIGLARGPDDLFACTPYINFRVVARYYDLIGPADEQLQRHMAADTPLPPAIEGRTTWMQGYMFDPRAEGELRTLLDVSRAQERLGVDSQKLIDAVKDQGLTVVRLSDDRFESWVYDAARDDFQPLSVIVAVRPGAVRAASSPDTRPPQ